LISPSKRGSTPLDSLKGEKETIAVTGNRKRSLSYFIFFPFPIWEGDKGDGAATTKQVVRGKQENIRVSLGI